MCPSTSILTSLFRIAHNNEYDFFEIDEENGGAYGMVEYPIYVAYGFGFSWGSNIAWEWEQLGTFLDQYKVVPTWIDCNYTWGWLEEETGLWTGLIGAVIYFSNI